MLFRSQTPVDPVGALEFVGRHLGIHQALEIGSQGNVKASGPVAGFVGFVNLAATPDRDGPVSGPAQTRYEQGHQQAPGENQEAGDREPDPALTPAQDRDQPIMGIAEKMDSCGRAVPYSELASAGAIIERGIQGQSPRRTQARAGRYWATRIDRGTS